MKGVSRYASSKLVGKLDSEIILKSKRKGMKVYGVCCSYDTDVFEEDESLIIDWKELRKSIMRLGIEEFCTVEVKSAIEDWLLDDLEGLCKFLKQKEVPNEDFIDCLSMEKIRNKRKAALSELEKILNVTIY